MNRYNQVPHLTMDTIRASEKIPNKHDAQDSQEISSFRQDSIIKTNMKYK